MRVTIYGSPGQMATITALEAGFKQNGDEVQIGYANTYTRPDDWTQMACFTGLGYPSIFNDHMRQGRHTLLIDTAYISPRTHYRLALDGFQSRFLHGQKERAPERLHKQLWIADLQLKPMERKRETRNNLVYVGSNQEYCTWHRLGVAVEYDVGQMADLISKMRNSYSLQFRPDYHCPEPLYWIPRRTKVYGGHSIEKLIKDGRVLITHGHPSAVHAIITGCPVLSLSGSDVMPIHPLCETDRRKAAQLHIPTEADRLRILTNIAWAEYTLEEIASGFALEHLTPYCVKRFEKHDRNPDDLDFIIDQYRMMHDHPKRYRGGLEEDQVAAIGGLVTKHKARTLLDYGCGKGRQYKEFKQHLEWGLPEPYCYDPGYPPFAKKPKGQFDGVVCTDVAEHLPESKVGEFLTDVIGYARKFAFFVIFTGPALKTLPDGRNCHLTVRPIEWWNYEIAKVLSEPGGGGSTEQPDPTKDTFVFTTAGNRQVVVMYKHKEE